MPHDLAGQVNAAISTGDGARLDELSHEAEKHALI
jgi:hypothetical protein